MKKLLSILMLSILTFAFANATTSEDVKEKSKEAAASAVDYSKEQKEKIQAEMEESLETMKVKLAELKVQAQKKAGSAKDAAKSEIADLEKSQKQLSHRLDKFKKSSGKAWGHMKAGFSEAFEKLSEAYDKAKENYK
jgi:Flp pilus assembly protein TadB